MSSLVGLGVDRHDSFVDAFFGGEVSQGFVLCHVLARAPGLMIEFGITAGGAGVPDGDVVATGEAVVVVVEVFVVVGWSGAGKGRCGHGSCGGWHDRDARRKRKTHGW